MTAVVREPRCGRRSEHSVSVVVQTTIDCAAVAACGGGFRD
eukprot:CAMPEP_0205921752 /NCGR_PEP_ID=MMETSP1325-20131115/13381_1 /ASSEMBLY_ACC=CAM_ASM_000708 /TAXON_ID=236786 /ORGANISM="Florenciella sp., Strain RCC1007" /LENGTH=40 /DNA_ID= /DNA_START= /DNA_END= /DNA_ORIENTATION=